MKTSKTQKEDVMKKSQMIVIASALIAFVALTFFTYNVIRALSSVSPDPHCGIRYTKFSADNQVSGAFALNYIISKSTILWQTIGPGFFDINILKGEC